MSATPCQYSKGQAKRNNLGPMMQRNVTGYSMLLDLLNTPQTSLQIDFCVVMCNPKVGARQQGGLQRCALPYESSMRHFL